MVLRYSHALPAALLSLVALTPAQGAVGCDLNNPDRDVARMFPGYTAYKSIVVDIQKLGGALMMTRVEGRLRDQLQGVYEMIDVPYTLYIVYKNSKVIGYVHGVNQRGYYGVMQLFLALNLDFRIKSLYLQKLSGPYVGRFCSPAFEGQFASLALEDYDLYEVATGRATGKVAAIKNPADGQVPAVVDFQGIQRGIKKNLILVDEFFKVSADLAAISGKPVKK